ncbi:beta-galactosidase, partial [Trifolium pratense]
RYYKRLKDDYYEFKISDSTYRCSFYYNKDYSLSDLLRHASRMAAFNIFNNANNNNHANNFHLRHIATETLDDNQPSLPEKLDDPAYKSKPKETEVVAEQDASVEVDESKDEKE